MSGLGATVVSDIACELGEGPTYDPSTGTMFWFDIVGRKLLEKRMPDGAVVVHDLPVMASALAAVDDKRQLMVTERGLEIRDRQTGKLTLHKAVEADNPLMRSNDSRVHPSGALWFGTMGKEKKDRPGAGSIYWYKAGEVRTLYPRIDIPNSICFSADGAIAYFTDTAKNVLMRVGCDPTTGLPTGEPQVFYDHSGKEGGLDGSVCDAEGVVWNARWGSACVDAYAPDGRRIRTVPVPALHSSCPVFVGKHAQHIAVTTAASELDEAQRKADTKAGWTFLLDIDVKGRFDPPVDL